MCALTDSLFQHAYHGDLDDDTAYAIIFLLDKTGANEICYASSVDTRGGAFYPPNKIIRA